MKVMNIQNPEEFLKVIDFTNANKIYQESIKKS